MQAFQTRHLHVVYILYPMVSKYIFVIALKMKYLSMDNHINGSFIYDIP